MNNSRIFAYGKAGLFLAKETLIPIAVVSILTSNPCLAQITPDTTLGNQNSRLTTGVNIKGSEADLIEGGVQRGNDLYHSQNYHPQNSYYPMHPSHQRNQM